MNAPQWNASVQGSSGKQTNVSGQKSALDLVRLQEQYRLAQMELARERKSHQIDKANASVIIARLEKAMAPARTASRSTVGDAKRAARWRLFFASIVLISIAVGSFLAIQNNDFLTRQLSIWQVHAAPRPVSDSSGETNHPRRISAATVGALPSFGATSDFSSAVSRLDRALSSLPGRPEAILQAIHTQAIQSTNTAPGSPVCDFEWNGGQPAIVYDGSGQSASLSGTLNSCAEAVENFSKKSGQEETQP